MQSVLVIEDNPDHFELIQDALLEDAEQALNITHTMRLGDGLKNAQDKQFDLVLCDLNLPDANSEQTVLQLKNIETTSPIVVLTSLKDLDLARSLLKHGVQDFLPKDEISAPLLQRICSYAVERKHHEREIEEQSEKIKNLAQKDALTGLFNRHFFEAILEKSFSRAVRARERLALIFVDLDNFKPVNDTYGHNVGDQLLIEVAARLQHSVRESDVLARVGGDEFLVLTTSMTTESEAAHIAKRILDSLEQPIAIDDVSLVVSASVGIAILDGERIKSKDDFIKCADLAMYRAKEHGRNQYCFYTEKVQDELARRLQLEDDLKRALSKGEISVFYQPMLSSLSKTLVGIEALARWNHPEFGLLEPEDFIQMADETGAMPALGKQILEQACADYARWRKRYDKTPFKLSLNLSATQLNWQGLVPSLQNAVKTHALTPSDVELEITENSLLRNKENISETFEKIAACKVGLALDNFGTGFSSFQHINLFPVTTIKIDRQFVQRLGQSEKNNRLLSAIIQFGKAMNLSIVAEGIETEQQAEFCTLHGCHVLQGYLFSPPLSAEDFEAKFLNRSA